MPETTRYALYLCGKSIQTERDSEGTPTGRVELPIVEVNQQQQIRNPSETLFENFMFRCQWHAKIDEFRPFGFEAEYRSVYAIDLAKAERHVKMLRKVSKVAFPISPNTFGQWASLMAKHLGITLLLRPTTQRGWSYSDNQHQFLPASSIQQGIDNAIADAQQLQTQTA